MKRLFYIVLPALLTVATFSCDRTDDTTDNTTDPTDSTTGEWVDLGLPSGLLWYSVNLGSTTTEGYGNYYAWGELQPKSVYSWDTYSYGDYDSVNGYTMYKYNTLEDYGTVDNKNVLEVVDDAATAEFGYSAHIPTYDDWVELRNNTTSKWIKQNGVKGLEFSASNGKSLFLPAAGYRNGNSLYDKGEYCGYWSSTIDTNYPYEAGSWKLRILFIWRGLELRIGPLLWTAHPRCTLY